jgi:hypothetical protein
VDTLMTQVQELSYFSHGLASYVHLPNSAVIFLLGLLKVTLKLLHAGFFFLNQRQFVLVWHLVHEATV